MAIKLQRGENKFVYKSSSGILTPKEKIRADKIYIEAGILFSKLKDKEADVLETWYLRGKAVNSIIRRFSIRLDERPYFWQMLYEVSRIEMPERVLDNTKRNDFSTASIMAKYRLKDLRATGPWTLWREILESTKVADDDRVAKWVIGYIFKHNINTRDGARPLLKFVRNRLANLDTSKLTNRELLSKLNEFGEK